MIFSKAQFISPIKNHRYMKRIIASLIVISCFLVSHKAVAQSDPMFSHYMFNTLNINPAYAGSTDYLSLTAISRHQWIGFEGAPTTQNFTAHSLVSDQIGAGFALVHDMAGPIRSMSMKANFSYSLTLTKGRAGARKKSGHSELAFGLMAGVSNYYVGLTDIENVNPANDAFHSDIYQYQPIFGAGLHYSFDNGFVGFSVPDLVETSYEKNASTWIHNRHYFLTGGYLFDLKNSFKLRPTLMTRYVKNAPLSAEITLSAIYDDMFWFGLLYRHNDAIGALASVQINNQIRIGYAYDYSILSLSSYQSGSHEIILSYDFNIAKSDFASPRYF